MAERVSTKGNPHLQRVYASTSVDETRESYDEWAATYDHDMLDQEYVAPALVAAEVARRVDLSGQFLDAGCGSGAVGIELAKLGAKAIDGVDLSPGMLGIARKAGAYRNLETADLSKRLRFDENSYDALVCCGTLTQGHVGPQALSEFVRVIKPDGVVVATVLDNIWASGGYEREVQRLDSEGLVHVESTDAHPYRRSANVFARVVTLRKRA
ncbi:hypothetical protein LTR85_002980 [Meristemomyces frigidus]|nr:hypothetical protein LTR85_002980 [Meristemomyces frigidus]